MLPDACRAPGRDLGRGGGGRVRRRIHHAWPARSCTTGEGDAILRLGWEFNGTWYPWSVTNRTDAAHFVGYFRHIVSTMRAVPGADFRFVWNADVGTRTRAGPERLSRRRLRRLHRPRPLRPGVGHPPGARAGVAPLRHRGQRAAVAGVVRRREHQQARRHPRMGPSPSAPTGTGSATTRSTWPRWRSGSPPMTWPSRATSTWTPPTASTTSSTCLLPVPGRLRALLRRRPARRPLAPAGS